MTQDPTAVEHPVEEPGTGSARIDAEFLDIYLAHAESSTEERVLRVVLAIAAGVAVVVAVLFAISLGHAAGGATAAVGVGGVVAGSCVVFAVRRRNKAEIRITTATRDIGLPLTAESIRSALGQPGFANRTDLHSHLAAWLAEQKQFGKAVRLRRVPAREQIEPLTVPFEPRELNECWLDPALFTSNTDEIASREASSENELRQGARAMRRYVRLTGGWLPNLITAIFAVRMTWQAIRTQAASDVIVASLFFALMFWLLFGPGGAAHGGASSWWVAPQTILIRSAKWNRKGTDRRIYSRASSVLAVSDWAEDGAKHVVVRDSEGEEETAITPDELRFLLRAWLSPVEPPTRELLLQLP